MSLPSPRRAAVATLALLLALGTASSRAGPSLLGKDKPDFLPVDQAFELQPLEMRDGKMVVGWRIAKDYYLYRHRMKFSLVSPAGTPMGEPVLPTGEKYHDEHFGDTQIYRDQVEVVIPAPEGDGPVELKVGYQGCADAGLCYPPQTRTLDNR